MVKIVWLFQRLIKRLKSEIKNDEVIVELHEGVHKQDMLRILLDHDMDIEKFMIYEPSLTDIFVAKAGDEA